MGYFDVSVEEITEGPIVRSMVLIAVPLLFQNTVMIGQQIVDLFWVGQLGSEAVTAIGLATPLVWLMIGISIDGVFTGTKVLVSQRVGADDADGARRAAFTGLAVALFLGLAVGGVVYVVADPLIGLVTNLRPGDSGRDAARMAVTYVQPIALGIFVAGMSDVTEAGFIARGDSKATLYINVLVVVTNVVLDPVLIFGAGPIPAMGIEGAALATVAGYASGLLAGVAFVVRGRAGKVYSRDAIGFESGDFRELAEIGTPESVRSAVGNVGTLLMISIVFVAGGSPGVAAYTVGSRVSAIALLSVRSLSSSAHSIVGQNIGAGRPDRATETVFSGMKIGLGLLAVIAVLQWTFAEGLARTFIAGAEGPTLALSVAFLQIFAIAYPASGVISVVTAGFNAARRTKTTMVFSLLQKWALQIPLAAALGILLAQGAVGVFWARSLSTILVGGSFFAYYLYTENNGMYAAAVEEVGSTSGD